MTKSEQGLTIYGILARYFPEYNEDTDTLQFVVGEILDACGQIEPLVMPQTEIKEKIITRLNKESYEQIMINGVPQYRYKPNHPIISEIIEIIKNMELK